MKIEKLLIPDSMLDSLKRQKTNKNRKTKMLETTLQHIVADENPLCFLLFCPFLKIFYLPL